MPFEAWIAIGAAVFLAVFVPLVTLRKKENHDTEDQR